MSRLEEAIIFTKSLALGYSASSLTPEEYEKMQVDKKNDAKSKPAFEHATATALAAGIREAATPVCSKTHIIRTRTLTKNTFHR